MMRFRCLCPVFDRLIGYFKPDSVGDRVVMYLCERLTPIDY